MSDIKITTLILIDKAKYNYNDTIGLCEISTTIMRKNNM